MGYTWGMGVILGPGWAVLGEWGSYWGWARYTGGRREQHWGELGRAGALPLVGIRLCWGRGTAGLGCTGGTGVSWALAQQGVAAGVQGPAGARGVGSLRALPPPRIRVPWRSGCPGVSPGFGCPGVSLGTGGWAVVAWQALTVVELVVGLLLAAVGRDTVDLHPHKGVHDGAPLLPVQFGQLLRRDHLGEAEGAGGWWHGAPRGDEPQEKGHGWHMAGCGDRAGAPRRRDMDGTWSCMGMGAVSPRSRDMDGIQRDGRPVSVSPGEERLVAPR